MNTSKYWTVSASEKNTVINVVAPPKSYSYDPDSDMFMCSHCHGTGLFPDGNGGIMHEAGCLASLIHRLGVTLPDEVEP